MTKYRLVKEDELRFMLRGYLKYLALQSGGVDNWEWYGESLGDFVETWAKEKGLDLEEDDYGFDDIVEEDLERFTLIIE